MEKTISVKQVINMLIKHIKLILICAILGGVIAYFYTVKFVTPLYSSSGKLYVQNKVTTSDTITSSDISAGSKLAKACSTIFKTETVLQPISDELKQEYGLNYSAGALASMISVQALEGSEMIQISVMCSDPVQAYRVCQMVVKVAPEAYKNIINTGTMMIVDGPKVNYGKIAPNETQSTTKGVMVGAFIAVAVALLVEFMTKQVKPDDDLYEMYGIPVFAEVLDFNRASKANSKAYSSYSAYASHEENENEDKSKKTENKKRGEK